ncbi:MAG: type II toxin-antitoxin system antitoxin, RelB/DinJ family, partial [Alloalcanivorax venustensis]
AWFKAKVLEAMEDTRAAAPHDQVMDDARKLIERKRVRKD